jgi:hypothetical protein
VEYYSALNDNRFSIFLGRLHDMLQNQEISAILRSGEKQGTEGSSLGEGFMEPEATKSTEAV